MIKQKFGVGDKLKCLKGLSHFNVGEYYNIVYVIKWDKKEGEYHYEIISHDGLNKINFSSYDTLSYYFDVKTLERKKKLEKLENII